MLYKFNIIIIIIIIAVIFIDHTISGLLLADRVQCMCILSLLKSSVYSSTCDVQPPIHPSQSGLISQVACYDREGHFYTHIFDGHTPLEYQASW